MKPWELFKLIKSIKHNEYITAGNDVQYQIRFDKESSMLMLIFEESCGNIDWKNNFNFPVKLYKKQESCIKAARGWGNAWKSCNDKVTSDMIAAMNENKPNEILICGWSYGGAIALLAAEDLYYRTKQKANVTTFGAPKPLWSKKTQKYVASCCNYVQQFSHVNDCVPLMPPLPGYKRLATDKVGKGTFSFFKLFKPQVYHCIYDQEEVY